MFTLFPYEDSTKTAKILNDQDLHDQIADVDRILNCLHQIEDVSGWHNSPGVLMWSGYEPQLCIHGLKLCQEYLRTGQTNNLEARLEWHLSCATGGSEFSMESPDWVKDSVLHLAHQSYMVRTNPDYRAYFGVSPGIAMIWPAVWPERNA